MPHVQRRPAPHGNRPSEFDEAPQRVGSDSNQNGTNFQRLGDVAGWIVERLARERGLSTGHARVIAEHQNYAMVGGGQ